MPNNRPVLFRLLQLDPDATSYLGWAKNFARQKVQQFGQDEQVRFRTSRTFGDVTVDIKGASYGGPEVHVQLKLQADSSLAYFYAFDVEPSCVCRTLTVIATDGAAISVSRTVEQMNHNEGVPNPGGLLVSSAISTTELSVDGVVIETYTGTWEYYWTTTGLGVNFVYTNWQGGYVSADSVVSGLSAGRWASGVYDSTGAPSVINTVTVTDIPGYRVAAQAALDASATGPRTLAFLSSGEVLLNVPRSDDDAGNATNVPAEDSWVGDDVVRLRNYVDGVEVAVSTYSIDVPEDVCLPTGSFIYTVPPPSPPTAVGSSVSGPSEGDISQQGFTTLTHSYAGVEHTHEGHIYTLEDGIPGGTTYATNFYPDANPDTGYWGAFWGPSPDPGWATWTGSGSSGTWTSTGDKESMYAQYADDLVAWQEEKDETEGANAPALATARARFREFRLACSDITINGLAVGLMAEGIRRVLKEGHPLSAGTIMDTRPTADVNVVVSATADVSVTPRIVSGSGTIQYSRPDGVVVNEAVAGTATITAQMHTTSGNEAVSVVAEFVDFPLIADDGAVVAGARGGVYIHATFGSIPHPHGNTSIDAQLEAVLGAFMRDGTAEALGYKLNGRLVVLEDAPPSAAIGLDEVGEAYDVAPPEEENSLTATTFDITEQYREDYKPKYNAANISDPARLAWLDSALADNETITIYPVQYTTAAFGDLGLYPQTDDLPSITGIYLTYGYEYRYDFATGTFDFLRVRSIIDPRTGESTSRIDLTTDNEIPNFIFKSARKKTGWRDIDTDYAEQAKELKNQFNTVNLTVEGLFDFL
jgi:hypothetical protein